MVFTNQPELELVLCLLLAGKVAQAACWAGMAVSSQNSDEVLFASQAPSCNAFKVKKMPQLLLMMTLMTAMMIRLSMHHHHIGQQKSVTALLSSLA